VQPMRYQQLGRTRRQLIEETMTRPDSDHKPRGPVEDTIFLSGPTTMRRVTWDTPLGRPVECIGCIIVQPMTSAACITDTSEPNSR
jgi:hypothetical protein